MAEGRRFYLACGLMDILNETIELNTQNFVMKRVTDIRLVRCFQCIVAKKKKEKGRKKERKA
jgi:hypothetical protein